MENSLKASALPYRISLKMSINWILLMKIILIQWERLRERPDVKY